LKVRPRKRTGWASLVELVIIVAVALGLALGIQAFLVKPYRIPSESMEPTLAIGQRVLVNRIGNDFSNPHVGEIVVFHPPKGADNARGLCGDPSAGDGHTMACDQPTPQRSDQTFIKRVVADPGDTVSIQGDQIFRNGKLEPAPFIRPCRPDVDPTAYCPSFPKPIKVPPGEWFMMGDNRGHSDDSRYWGPVPKKWIIGGAFATYWPPDRIGIL
jgi:signal peptidase I